MKMKKSKVLLTLLCAVALVATSVFGTLAYLTSEDTVVNTFTVGNVAITLDEQDVDNSTEGENDRDKANAYKLMPGHEYVKDPIIHVSSTSEDCYLFVKVDDQIAAIEASATVAEQMAAKGWVAVKDNIYIYTNGSEKLAVSAGANVPVFENFTIRGDVDNGTLATYNNKTITVTAYAVQKDGFENSAPADIWAATFGAPVVAG